MVMGIVEIIKYLHTKVTVSSPMAILDSRSDAGIVGSARHAHIVTVVARLAALAGVVEVGSLLLHIIS